MWHLCYFLLVSRPWETDFDLVPFFLYACSLVYEMSTAPYCSTLSSFFLYLFELGLGEHHFRWRESRANQSYAGNCYQAAALLDGLSSLRKSS
jgi:hypothetical protein